MGINLQLPTWGEWWANMTANLTDSARYTLDRGSVSACVWLGAALTVLVLVACAVARGADPDGPVLTEADREAVRV